MANRSYLYSTNVIPGTEAKKEDRKSIGISEWNYDIPIVFKLLLSGNPRTCKSSIWEIPEDIALVGDYAAGVECLEALMSKIKVPEAQSLVSEAMAFLRKPENQNQFLVLEGGEIFDMGQEPLSEQNLALLEEIKNLQSAIEHALQSLQPPPIQESQPLGFSARIFGAKPEPARPTYDPMKPVHVLGLGNWSNILCFDVTHA